MLKNVPSRSVAKPGSSQAGRYLRTFASMIGYTLAMLVAALLALPVALLPLATRVPAPLWVFLAILDVALLILLFRLRPTWIGITASLAGVTLVSVLAVAASQHYTFTPPITNASGQPLPGSIAVLEQVELNGSRQWISIRGRDANNPVLLFLAGGPGGSQLVTGRRVLQGLEDHFVVVNWEQPGAGKSFDAVDRSTLTPERYIGDGQALVEYLQQRFDEEKVYVLGESWGSVLGIWLVQRYPGMFHAFIGTGQMVAFLENDLICYEFALDWARQRGDLAKVEKLESQGPPPYYGKDVAWKESAFLMDTYTYMNQNPAISDDGFNTWGDLAGSEYGLYDKLNWFRGALDTLGVVYPQLWEVDFRLQAASLEVPVYFLIGRHDVNAPTVLAEEYFAMLEAPHKEFIWFEHSGHNPWVNESAKFVDVVVNTVLAQTRP
jgi:pimeloyl-ACP methyl ester carboxylesterase